jgi:hypothetical protein
MSLDKVLADLASENVEALMAAITDNAQIVLNGDEDEKIFGELLGDLQNPDLLDLVHPLIADKDDKIIFYAIDRALLANRLPHAELLAKKYLQKYKKTIEDDIWERYIGEARSNTALPVEFMLHYNGFAQLIKSNRVNLFRAIKYTQAFESLLAAGLDASALNSKGESIFYAIIGSTVPAQVKQQLCGMLHSAGQKGLSIEPCGEFSLSPAFYCIKLGYSNLYQYFLTTPGLEKLKTAANENVVHYLSRYNSTRFVPELPKEHLEHLFSEEDSTGVFAFERYVLAQGTDTGNRFLCEAFARAFKTTMQQGKKMQYLKRVLDFLGRDLAQHYIDEFMNEINDKKDNIPWLNNTSLNLAEIPLEILLLICEKLSPSDVLRLTRVAKSLQLPDSFLRAILIKYKPLLKLEKINDWHEIFANEARFYHNWMTGRYVESDLNWADQKPYKFLNLDEHWLVTIHHMMTASVLSLWNCATKKWHRTKFRISKVKSTCFLSSSADKLPTVVLYDGTQVQLFRDGTLTTVPIPGEQNRTDITVRPVAANIFLFDGIVWDVDANQALHTFKREKDSNPWSCCFNPFTKQYIIQVDKAVLEVYDKEFKWKRRIQFSDERAHLVCATLARALDENVVLFHSFAEAFTLDLQTLETKSVAAHLRRTSCPGLTRVIEHSGILFQLVDQRLGLRSKTYITPSFRNDDVVFANSKYLFIDSRRPYYEFDS